MSKIEKNIYQIDLTNPEICHKIFGKLDENVRFLEDQLDVRINLKDGYLEISGNDEKNKIIAKKTIENLIDFAKNSNQIAIKDVEYVLGQYRTNPSADRDFKSQSGPITFTAVGKPIRPKTLGQRKYVETIRKNDITFAIGPAGTGKTYLAVAMAVKAFKDRQVEKIILTRPAVEAGESLGYLPGDLQMKVDPYLRPLYDAIFDLLGANTFNNLLEKNIIEVAPLAYMRGRTLDNAYIILDEGQNTTSEQMKMFLTRMGAGSKVIVTGDITQIDLKPRQKSGLVEVQNILNDIDGIGFSYLNQTDVVRHRMVQAIINAYESKASKLKEDNKDA